MPSISSLGLRPYMHSDRPATTSPTCTKQWTSIEKQGHIHAPTLRRDLPPLIHNTLTYSELIYMAQTSSSPLPQTQPSIPLSHPLCTAVTRTVTQHPTCAVTSPSMIDHQAPLSFEYQDPPAPLIIRRAYEVSTLPLAFPLNNIDVSSQT